MKNKTMNKIEIKEIVDVLQEALDSLMYEREGVKLWIRDLDIDLLKCLPEEYKKLSFNQSQRQPEGVISGNGDGLAKPTKDCDCACCKAYFENKPEEQEGWREELLQEKWVEDLLRMAVIAYIHKKEEVVIDLPSLIDFISRLLSEEFEKGVIKGRLEALSITKKLLSERTEEVLDQIHNFVESEMLTIEKQGANVILEYIEEWTSKLLKEKE